MIVVLSLSSGPTREPVSLDEVKAHLRIDEGDDYTLVGTLVEDGLLNNYITMARNLIEAQCGPLITQTWIQYQDEWPSSDTLELIKPRIQSVTSVKYKDDGGTEYTFSSSYYDADTVNDRRGRIVLKPTQEWPTDALYSLNPIYTTFVCGYGDDPEDVPEPIRYAMMFLVGHWYEERQPVIVNDFRAVSVQEIPFTVDALLANYRYWCHF